VSEMANWMLTCFAICGLVSVECAAVSASEAPVRWKNRIMARPQSLSLSEGQRGIFSCEAEDPALQLHWSKKEGALSSTASAAEKGRLMFSQVKPSDSGDYICTGKRDNVDVGSVTVTLAVNPGNSSDTKGTGEGTVEIQIVRKKVNEHESPKLECYGAGGSANVSWAKIDDTMPTNAVAKDGFLQFTDVKLEDAGFYECEVGVAASDENVPQNVVQLIVKKAPVQAGAAASGPKKTLEDEIKALRQQLEQKTKDLQNLNA